MLGKIEAFLNGKKTYIVAAVIGIEAALQALNISIPGWVTTLLGALGLGAVRSAIDNSQAAPKA